MIRFTCPACRKILKVSDEGSGRKISCPKCGQRMLIPTPTKPAATNPTVLGELTPSTPSGPPPSLFAESDSLKLLGLRKDSEMEAGGEEQPGYKPARSWAGTICASLALMLAIAAMPAAVVHHPLLGASLAALGLLFGAVALLLALVRRGVGCGLSIVATAVCCSVLFAAIKLFNKDAIPDNRLAVVGAANQDQEAEQERKNHQDVDNKNEHESHTSQPDGGKGSSGDKDKHSSKSVGIRISGIRKQKEFLGPISSDLDMWKTNPVEADSKWKGKVVEVEMSLSDLEIKTGKDGLAFLLTIDNEFWRAAGVQHSAFVFSEQNRRQLVGLHEQDGNIVIRGRCLGLERGRVAFEDCEIIKKPVQTAKDGQKNKKDDSPQFDPNDIERTVLWIGAGIQALEKEKDNGVRYRKAQQKFDDGLWGHGGTKIHWALTVDAITEKEVVLQGTFFPPNGPAGILGIGRAALKLSMEGGNETNQPPQLRIGSDITEEKASQLKPGDSLTVRGFVVRIARGGRLHENEVIVILKNLRAD